MAMAFPTDCLPPAYSKKKAKNYLPPEGYFESREAYLCQLMHGLNQEATNLQLRGRYESFLTVFYACDRNRQPPNTLDKRQTKNDYASN